MFHELSQLLYPTRCYGCKSLGPSICSNCKSELQLGFYKTRVEAITVYSGLLYTNTASKIIIAAKENGFKAADELIIAAILGTLEKLHVDSKTLHLVPIPSSRQTQRRRGRSFIADLTQEMSAKTGIAINDCLEISRKVKDQSTLRRAERVANMHGAFNLKSSPRGDLLIIDDVVTTGATLREAIRAINSQRTQGMSTISAVTACVAQPLRYGVEPTL